MHCSKIQRPLLLAKILGMYTVGFKNTKTGDSKRIDVIVMENLLCGCKYQKVPIAACVQSFSFSRVLEICLHISV